MTLHFNNSEKMDNDKIIVLFSLKKNYRNILKFKNNPKFHVNEICEIIQYIINQKDNTTHVWTK